MVHRSFQNNCLICHTEDMIAGQRLTPAQWKAEVDKMVNWGSPLPREEVAPLVEFLARKFSDREAPPVPSRSTLKAVGSLEGPVARGKPAVVSGDLARGERLYAANCATCHGPTALGGDLGPSLAAKVILDHSREYDQIVNQGLRRMPGFRMTMTTRDQADVLGMAAPSGLSLSRWPEADRGVEDEGRSSCLASTQHNQGSWRRSARVGAGVMKDPESRNPLDDRVLEGLWGALSRANRRVDRRFGETCARRGDRI